MSYLTERSCTPVTDKTPRVEGEGLEQFLSELSSGWSLVDGHHLEKEFTFADFVDALCFVNDIGAVAETEGHHPDIYLTYGKVRISIFTHAVNGLTESDFILAAKIDLKSPSSV